MSSRALSTRMRYQLHIKPVAFRYDVPIFESIQVIASNLSWPTVACCRYANVYCEISSQMDHSPHGQLERCTRRRFGVHRSEINIRSADNTFCVTIDGADCRSSMNSGADGSESSTSCRAPRIHKAAAPGTIPANLVRPATRRLRDPSVFRSFSDLSNFRFQGCLHGF